MAICLHLAWGSMILADSSLAGILPLFVAELFGSPQSTAIVLIVCALLAGMGLMWDRRPTLLGLFLLPPQQFVLTVSAISTITLLGNDKYLWVPTTISIYPIPLGTLGSMFILAPVLFAAVFHTFAVVDGYSQGGWQALRQILSGLRRKRE